MALIAVQVDELLFSNVKTIVLMKKILIRNIVNHNFHNQWSNYEEVSKWTRLGQGKSQVFRMTWQI